MYNTLEIFAVILIILIQFIIAYRAYSQINQLNSFLPEGRNSLTLKEYEIPSEEILELEPNQVVDRIAYLSNHNTVSSESISSDKEDYVNPFEQEEEETIL